MSDDWGNRFFDSLERSKKGDVSDSASLACSIDNGPMTVSQRVDRLFDENEFPTYEKIERVIWDAEFDTLNFPEIISKRHGQ